MITKPLITRHCELCANPFTTIKAEINRGNGRFCSLACSARRSHGGDVTNFQCSHCDKPIRVKPSKLGKGKTGLHFCGRECMDTHHWRLREAYPPRYGLCLMCDNPIRKGTMFCKVKCRQEHTQKTYIADWLAGDRDGKCGEGAISSHIRKWLFEKYDHKCQECGWSKVHVITGRIPLTVNHKDGNSANNRPENLELLCPNCHSLTSNYGSLNKGNGRPKRLLALRRKMERNVLEVSL